MSEVIENPAETTSAEPTGTEPNQQGESTYTPPATQEDLNRIVQNRVRKVEAKYADYDQIKAEAEKVSGLVAERDDYKSQLDTANAELATYKAKEQKRQWAVEVAEETGVPAEALRGETKEDMMAHAKTLEKYVKVSGPVVSGDGKSPSTPAAVTARDKFAAAFEGLI